MITKFVSQPKSTLFYDSKKSILFLINDEVMEVSNKLRKILSFVVLECLNDVFTASASLVVNAASSILNLEGTLFIIVFLISADLDLKYELNSWFLSRP